MQEAKEDVRSRLNIEDVIGEYVQLRRAGRNFKGLSPFTAEKTPSFIVSPDKHIWHDFSSNKGGDIFTFVMEVEGMDFRQSLEHLARKAGVDLSMYETKGSQDVTRRKKRLLEAHSLATKYYQQTLMKNQHALEYVFKKRGLSKEIVTDFQIGYAPAHGDALVSFLTKKGFSTPELAAAGLTNRFGGDLFRGRMTVPLMDASGMVIGFTGRIIDDEPSAPKYLNTPQTLLYDKSRHVFGLSQAKEAIRTSGYSVIVEGNLDVVSSHQAGVRQVVATAGTAMTEHHLRALKRLSANVRLAFDGDKAGLAATERAVPIAGSVGVELTIVSLPEGYKDPDELIQRDVSLWQAAIDTARPAVDWILDQYARREDVTTAAGKRAFTTAALAITGELNDSVEREHYEQKIAAMVGSSLEAIRSKSQQTTRSEKRPLKMVKPAGESNSFIFSHIDTLLGLALTSPNTHDLFKDTILDMFTTEPRRAVAEYLASHGPANSGETPPELRKFDEYVKIVIVRAEKRYESWSEQDRYFETAKLLKRYENEYRLQQIEDSIKAAQDHGDAVEESRLRVQHNELMKEMKRG